MKASTILIIIIFLMICGGLCMLNDVAFNPYGQIWTALVGFLILMFILFKSKENEENED